MFGFSLREQICRDYFNTLDQIGEQLDQQQLSNREKACLLFWTGIVPRAFFQSTFLENWQMGLTVILKKATRNFGTSCAHLTQAYVIYVFQNFLKNDKAFEESMGFSSDFVEDILKKILGINHPVIQYLNFFRTKFDGEIHPLDQPIFYIAQITKLLIPEKLVAEKTLREWDSNLVTKVVFIASEEKFFEGMKTGAVKHFG